MSQRLFAGIATGLLGAMVVVTSTVTATQTLDGFSPKGTAPRVATQSTTERPVGDGDSKVDRCVRALVIYRLSDDDVQKADKATVTCSKITSKRDAKALTKWIKGTKGYTHKWAYEIVG